MSPTRLAPLPVAPLVIKAEEFDWPSAPPMTPPLCPGSSVLAAPLRARLVFPDRLLCPSKRKQKGKKKKRKEKKTFIRIKRPCLCVQTETGTCSRMQSDMAGSKQKGIRRWGEGDESVLYDKSSSSPYPRAFPGRLVLEERRLSGRPSRPGRPRHSRRESGRVPHWALNPVFGCAPP